MAGLNISVPMGKQGIFSIESRNQIVEENWVKIHEAKLLRDFTA